MTRATGYTLRSPISLPIGATPNNLPDKYKDLYGIFQNFHSSLYNILGGLQNYAGIHNMNPSQGAGVDLGSTVTSNFGSRIYPLAGEALAAGDFVTINASGKAVKSTHATGFVGCVTSTKAAVLDDPVEVTCGFACIRELIGGLTTGTTYYLSSATPGRLMAGTFIPYDAITGGRAIPVGKALSPTVLLMNAVMV